MGDSTGMNKYNRYTESILFEYDLAPSASGTMTHTMHKNGTVKGLKYYLDPSCDDNVHVDLFIKKRLGVVQNLFKFADGGMKQIHGTNYGQQIDLNLNIELVYSDQIVINMVSTSTLDCTIMAVVNVEYEGGQW